MKDERGAAVAAFISWLALIVAILALLIGWRAYNRTGTNLEDRIQRGVERGINAAQQETTDEEDEEESADDDDNTTTDDDGTQEDENDSGVEQP